MVYSGLVQVFVQVWFWFGSGLVLELLSQVCLGLGSRRLSHTWFRRTRFCSGAGPSKVGSHGLIWFQMWITKWFRWIWLNGDQVWTRFVRFKFGSRSVQMWFRGGVSLAPFRFGLGFSIGSELSQCWFTCVFAQEWLIFALRVVFLWLLRGARATKGFSGTLRPHAPSREIQDCC